MGDGLKLFLKFRRPWRFEPIPNLKNNRVGFVIYDADDNVVLSTGTYSGDGDEEINLLNEDAERLVSFVNSR